MSPYLHSLEVTPEKNTNDVIVVFNIKLSSSFKTRTHTHTDTLTSCLESFPAYCQYWSTGCVKPTQLWLHLSPHDHCVSEKLDKGFPLLRMLVNPNLMVEEVGITKEHVNVMVNVLSVHLVYSLSLSWLSFFCNRALSPSRPMLKCLQASTDRVDGLLKQITCAQMLVELSLKL